MVWYVSAGNAVSQLRRPMPSGPSICMAQPTTEDTTLVVEMCWRWTSWRMSGVLRGGLGGSNSDRSSLWRHSRRDLAAEAARVSPKTLEGTEWRRARGATHTVAWRARTQKIMENVTYFYNLSKERFWSRIKAR